MMSRRSVPKILAGGFGAIVVWALLGEIVAIGGPALAGSASKDDDAPKPRTKKIEALLEEYAGTLEEVVVYQQNMYRTGLTDIQSVVQARTALLEARSELAKNAAERVRSLEELLKELSDWQKAVEDRVSANLVPQSDALSAKALRLLAEIRLERAKLGAK